MKTTASLYLSTCHNAWYNQTFERMLLSRAEPGEMIVYLWQNDPTIFIGRFQNAWQECDFKQLEAEGGRLARRISGGGAVYHDTNNLNFSFIARDDLYDSHAQTAVILAALRRLGLEADFSGRNDIITPDGKKFSGNAYYHKDGVSLQHGTLLVDVELSRLGRYLHPAPAKLAARGVDSVRARVVNLREIIPTLDVETVKQALVVEFREHYALKLQENVDTAAQTDPALYEQFAAWEWRYGAQGDFAIQFSQRFPWGGWELSCNTDQGLIREARLYSDALDVAYLERLEAALPGLRLAYEPLAQAIQAAAQTEAQQGLARDLCDFLQTQPL